MPKREFSLKFKTGNLPKREFKKLKREIWAKGNLKLKREKSPPSGLQSKKGNLKPKTGKKPKKEFSLKFKTRNLPKREFKTGKTGKREFNSR